MVRSGQRSSSARRIRRPSRSTRSLTVSPPRPGSRTAFCRAAHGSWCSATAVTTSRTVSRSASPVRRSRRCWSGRGSRSPSPWARRRIRCAAGCRSARVARSATGRCTSRRSPGRWQGSTPRTARPQRAAGGRLGAAGEQLHGGGDAQGGRAATDEGMQSCRLDVKLAYGLATFGPSDSGSGSRTAYSTGALAGGGPPATRHAGSAQGLRIRGVAAEARSPRGCFRRRACPSGGSPSFLRRCFPGKPLAIDGTV